MFIHCSNKNILNKDLHEVLVKFYTMEVLWPIMLELVYPVLRKEPPEKRPNKAQLVGMLENIFESEELLHRMFEIMNPKLFSVLEAVVWGGNQRLEELEKTLGFAFMKRKTVKPKYYYDEEKTKYSPFPEFHWLVYEEQGSYYSSDQYILVGLPPAVRTAFKKSMPKPKGYHLNPLPKLPEKVLTFRCDDKLAEDFRVVADYIDRGHLQFNKNETIRKPCIRALSKITQGGDFFPDEKNSKKLPLLRHELFVSLIASCGPTLRKAMLEEPPRPDKLLRPLCDTLFEHPNWFHEIVLSHIKTGDFQSYDKEATTQLRNLFSMLPPNQWVSSANLENIVNYRDIEIDPMPYMRCQVSVAYTHHYYNRSSKIEISSTNGWPLLIVPLIQGTAFLLAALGLAEIAYTLPPENAQWKSPSEQFLTPYDGLYAMRLTPAGAYALGLTDEIELKTSNHARAEIILNPQRLTATCRHIDPITEMSLLEYMEKVSDGCYRMTRQSLLRGCSVQKDVEQRVANFRKHIAQELPPFWKTFFESVAQTAVALKAKSSYKLYELANTPELRRLFMTDPVLREKTLKVEGVCVAIKKIDEPAISRRLTTLGYLMR